MDKARPYIGITGFMEADEVTACLNYWRQVTNPTPQYLLMIGVLVSSKTITGHANAWSNKFPKRQYFRRIFQRSDYLFNCLHFATRDPERLYDHLMLALEYSNGLADGIQLNLVWPDEAALWRVKTQYPRLKFVLQVSPHLAGYLLMSPAQIANTINVKYGRVIDYVLVDFSRGFGKQLPLTEVCKFLSLIEMVNPQISLGTCGGLEADNLRQTIGKLITDYPQLSFDTERRLRDDSPLSGQLDLAAAKAYLQTAATILGALPAPE